MRNPFVAGNPGVRAIVGTPLIGRDGLPLGALTLVDCRLRRFTQRQLQAVETIAEQVVAQFELRRIDQVMGRAEGDCPGNDPLRLRRALDDGALVPYFQPIVELPSDRPIGFEALLRWHHRELGVLSPGAFLPAIESSGLILPVGRHLLEESLQLFTRLRVKSGDGLIGVAVNVSPVELAAPGYATGVLNSLAGHGVDGHWLTIEILESRALSDDQVALTELHHLREAGVHIAIDDYGAGHSNLLRVLDLPIATLELDGDLVRRLPAHRRALAAIRSTLDVARELGLDVVAEGIETQEQRDALVTLGCQRGQGYLFSRPLAPSRVPEYLNAHPVWIPRPRRASGLRPSTAASSRPACRPSQRGHLRQRRRARDGRRRDGGEVVGPRPHRIGRHLGVPAVRPGATAVLLTAVRLPDDSPLGIAAGARRRRRPARPQPHHRGLTPTCPGLNRRVAATPPASPATRRAGRSQPGR